MDRQFMIHLMIPADLAASAGLDLREAFLVIADEGRLIIEQPDCDGDCEFCPYEEDDE